MFENEMHLSFSSLSQNESFARGVIGAFVAQLNPTLEQITDIRTAVSEAVTNAIIHGYEGTKGIVELYAKISGPQVVIEVRDNGKGIEDVKAAREPFYTSRPELERSGMGFTVMETFMDEVEVESSPGKGTSVILKKRINPVKREIQK